MKNFKYFDILTLTIGLDGEYVPPLKRAQSSSSVVSRSSDRIVLSTRLNDFGNGTRLSEESNLSSEDDADDADDADSIESNKDEYSVKMENNIDSSGLGDEVDSIQLDNDANLDKSDIDVDSIISENDLTNINSKELGLDLSESSSESGCSDARSFIDEFSEPIRYKKSPSISSSISSLPRFRLEDILRNRDANFEMIQSIDFELCALDEWLRVLSSKRKMPNVCREIVEKMSFGNNFSYRLVLTGIAAHLKQKQITFSLNLRSWVAVQIILLAVRAICCGDFEFSKQFRSSEIYFAIGCLFSATSKFSDVFIECRQPLQNDLVRYITATYELGAGKFSNLLPFELIELCTFIEDSH